MPHRSDSNFFFGYQSEACFVGKSEYAHSFTEGDAIPKRESYKSISSSVNPILHYEDEEPFPRSSTHDAYRGDGVTIPLDSLVKPIRTESHFSIGYVAHATPKTEYKDVFDAVAASTVISHRPPKPPRIRAESIFPCECDSVDYVTESQRALPKRTPLNTTQQNHSAMDCVNSSKLRESHFTLGSISPDSYKTPKSTAHSHYAKRIGLGARAPDPDIISMRHELSRSHFSFCES